MEFGYLSVNVYASDVSTPLKDAEVSVVGFENKNYTNDLGKTDNIVLETENKENSFDFNNKKVSICYDIVVSKEGFSNITIKGIEIYSGIITVQNVFMHPKELNKEEEIILDPIVIEGNYSAKYEEKQLSKFTPKILKKVLIPEYLIVHDGYPNDSSAPNYYVNFSDYIKNVASCEVYPTWNKEALKANILAIISFTLNRIYTEWYQSKGYNFSITSITAYDQKYSYGKTYFDSISLIVDEVMPVYIKRSGNEEPLFAQYCDGKVTQNKGWLYQWGSNELAGNGYNYEYILKYYYGNNLSFEKADYISGLPTSFPGYNLSKGDCGEEVKVIQEQMNIIRGNYPGLIEIKNTNGEFDDNTEESIKFFQKTFYLKVTGIVDYDTWYKLSYLYTAIKKMLNGVYDR